ncbi:beta-N-acetylhexosaminidase [Virgibacillus sp. 19R1-5]|nr:beta-N-acetylhexosaminidase [Virgibacillus sp. 19R1-5]
MAIKIIFDILRFSERGYNILEVTMKNLSAWSLDEKIGQLLMVGFNGTHLSSEIIELISEKKIGSVILFSRNIRSEGQIKSLTSAIQNIAQDSCHYHPILIATDQENGVVSRLQHLTPLPGNMALGAVNDLNITRKVSLATANALRQVGINMNLAPVLDVNNNPSNPVIGTRSFGENSNHVAKHGIAFLKGHQAEKVYVSAKHFPGHGNTSTDSHIELPVVSNSLEELKQIELRPFMEVIKNNVDSIMVNHVHYSSLDDSVTPASLSKNIVYRLLRNELGFEGVILTDCLEMNAISESVGVGGGAVKALQAGADMIMVSHTYEAQLEAISSIKQAVQKGTITIEQINRSVNRIFRLKSKYSDIKTTIKINNEELSRLSYSKAISVVHHSGILPIKENEKISVIWVSDNSYTKAEDNQVKQLSVKAFIKNDIFCEHVVENTTPVKELEQVTNEAIKSEYILLLFNANAVSDSIQSMVNIFLQKNRKLIVFALRSPYILSDFSSQVTKLAVYDFNQNAIQAALNIVAGKTKPTGVTPVTIK